MIKHDYGEHNHPVTTNSDAAQPMGRKEVFLWARLFSSVKLQTDGRWAVGTTTFLTFGSGTFAYQRLAQALIRSLSVFTSVISE